MTPDELVNKIFAIQNECNPETDPGDIAIDIQDDSALNAVMQNGRVIGMGASIQEALEHALKNVEKGLFAW